MDGPGLERENEIENINLETQSAKRSVYLGHEHFITTELEAGLDAIPQPAPPGLQQLPQLEGNSCNEGTICVEKGYVRNHSFTMA
jgi:hypothetical protein